MVYNTMYTIRVILVFKQTEQRKETSKDRKTNQKYLD